jgi:toxin FitB
LYLIDTMVLSELRRRQRDAGVVAWIAEQRQEDCFLSVVSVGEIERGIARRRAADPVFAGELAAWLDRLLRLHGERLLAVDLATARRWGQLSAALGHDSADLLIAATALEHGLTVVTRNLRHFTPTGVATLNPWQTAGEG